ncbi:hypothetical protein [Halonatronum saccharophilum]|uniref:hypothetical protein n=1 Tax=Halonatronum saccharophilum TaxID=150060 RepID=UPI0004846BC9|nr:hypothetical protein [Halonatronum saccharophilum]
MVEMEDMDFEVDNYIEENLECSEVLADFLEIITLLLKEGTKSTVEKVEPEDLYEETNKEIYGVELSISLLLSHEGYAQSEIFLFNTEERRDKFYYYLIKIIKS